MILAEGHVTGQSKVETETLLSNSDVIVSDIYVGMDDRGDAECNRDYFT